MTAVIIDSTKKPPSEPLTTADLSGLAFGNHKYELIDGTLFVTSHGEPFTPEDLDRLPDDGRRHELLGGALVMSPAPGFAHQLISDALTRLLHAARTDGLTVVSAPFDVVLPDNTVIEPDVVVAKTHDFTATNLPVAPELAVEVLSASTRIVDLGAKASLLAEAGCPSYWTIDPESLRLIARELRDGEYVVVADLTGDELFEARLPYPVSFRVSDLREP